MEQASRSSIIFVRVYMMVIDCLDQRQMDLLLKEKEMYHNLILNVTFGVNGTMCILIGVNEREKEI